MEGLDGIGEDRPMGMPASAGLWRQIDELVEIQRAGSLSDRELLRRFVGENDQAAFTALVHRHGPLVLGHCRRMLGQEAEAEDVFQATFLVLIRKAASLHWKESIGSWLYEVAHRLALRARADAVRRAHRPDRCSGETAPDPLGEITGRELVQVVDEELARLGETYRAPVLLCLLEGLTQEEAARRLGWSLSTLRRRLERGRNLLGVRLARRGLALPAALGAVLLGSGSLAAGVPPVLARATIEAARLLAAGQSVAGVVPVQAQALANAALGGMAGASFKAGVMLVLALGLLGAGVVLRSTGPTARQPDAPARKAHAPATEVDLAERRAEAPPADRRAVSSVQPGGLGFPVVFTPDGQALVTAGADDHVILWDRATGQRLRQFAAGAASEAVAVSPEGKMLAVGLADHSVRLWNVGTGKEIARCQSHRDRIHTVAFSPDGRLLASGSRDATICLWDTATGKEVRSWRADAEWCRFLTFSRDGKTLAVLGVRRDLGKQVGIVQLWETASGKEVRQTRVATNNPLFDARTGLGLASLAFTAEGKLTLAWASTDGTARLYDGETGQEVRRLPAVQQGVYVTLAFSPDGQTLAARTSIDPGVRLVDAPSGRALASLSLPADPPDLRAWKWTGQWFTSQSVAFAPDGKTLAVGLGTGTIHLLELASAARP